VETEVSVQQQLRSKRNVSDLSNAENNIFKKYILNPNT